MSLPIVGVTTEGYSDIWRGFVSHGDLAVYAEYDGVDASKKGKKFATQLSILGNSSLDLSMQYEEATRILKHTNVSAGAVVYKEKDILSFQTIASGAILWKEGDTIISYVHPMSSSRLYNPEKDSIICTSSYIALSLPHQAWNDVLGCSTKEDISDALLTYASNDMGRPLSAMIIAPTRSLREDIRTWYGSPNQKKDDEKNEEKKIRRLSLWTGIAILCCISLVVGMFLTLQHRKDLALRKEALEKKIQGFQNKIEQANMLHDLNPERSKQMLSDIRAQAADVLGTMDASSEYRTTLQSLISQTEAGEQVINHIVSMKSVPLFFDIRFIKPEGIGTRIIGYDTTKIILDTVHHVAYNLQTDTKQAMIIAGQDVVGDASEADLHGNVVYLLRSDGIVSYSLTEKTTEMVIPKDSEWGGVTSFGSYAGNLYLLDPIGHIIWKYQSTEEGYEPKQPYLAEGVEFSANPHATMLIDGSIWVNNGDTLEKYLGGGPYAFTPTHVPDPIASYDRVSTSDRNEYLYILEKAKKRVIVLKKDGEYVKQYRWDGFSDTSDIVASEEEKKLFILSGSNIYAIALE